MKDHKQAAGNPPHTAGASFPNRILGTLRDALQAASRESTGEVTEAERASLRSGPEPRPPTSVDAAAKAATLAEAPAQPAAPATQVLSAAEALREAKAPGREHFEVSEPTTRVVRGPPPATKPAAEAKLAPGDVGRTQAVRGKPKVARSTFHQDPVVGWVVVVGGPGLGAYRPIFEGNNTLGRSKTQRIPIDFGDETISSEEQAYIRYDSVDRAFLFIPNLAKTNVVSINNKKPTGAVPLQAMDVITVGHTQLAFVPFCGEEFDWAALTDLKE
jgi:hypothetical protein